MAKDLSVENKRLKNELDRLENEVKYAGEINANLASRCLNLENEKKELQKENEKISLSLTSVLSFVDGMNENIFNLLKMSEKKN